METTQQKRTTDYWKKIADIQQTQGLGVREAQRYYRTNVKGKTSKTPQTLRTNSEQEPEFQATTLDDLFPAVKNYIRKCGSIEVAKMLLQFVDEAKKL